MAKFPEVFAFEKKIIPSDGYLYGTTWDESIENMELNSLPLELNAITVKGTKSSKGEKKPEESNIQTVDTCKLGAEQDTLKLNFTLKFIGNLKTPSACSDKTYRDNHLRAIKGFTNHNDLGFSELATRYAINIANARFLWRNRVGAEKIAVMVKTVYRQPEKNWVFDAKSFDLRNFDDNRAQVHELAELIENVLSDSDDYLLLDISAFAQIGNKIEVHPSEEFIQNKGSKEGDKSKVLYEVPYKQKGSDGDHIAAIHSQKLGNAIRTIDTWYKRLNENFNNPIAVEPFGSVVTLKEAFRNETKKEEKTDFYTLYEKFIEMHPKDENQDNGEGTDPDKEERKFSDEEKNIQNFICAVLIRGGVFSESNKEK